MKAAPRDHTQHTASPESGSPTPAAAAPDITELLEAILDMRAALGAAAMYCDHPEVRAIPFAQSSEVVAERAREVMAKATGLLRRAGSIE